MTLQIHNQTEPSIAAVISPDHKGIGEALLKDFIAEVKTKHSAATDVLPIVNSSLAAARTILETLNNQKSSKLKTKDYKFGKAILEAPLEQQAAVALKAMSSVVHQRHSNILENRLHNQLLKSLIRKKLPYSDSDILRMLAMVKADFATYLTLPVLSILSNIERCTEERGLCPAARKQLTHFARTFHPNAYGATERKIGVRLKELLDRPDPVSVAKSESIPGESKTAEVQVATVDYRTGEAWTDTLLGEFEKLSEKSQNQWHQLLQHCSAAKASKPTKKWMNRTEKLAEPIGLAEIKLVLDPVLASIGKPGEPQRFNYGGTVQFGEETLIHDTHADMLRGLVWSTSLYDDSHLIGLVGDAAEKCFQKIRDVGPRSPKVGNACLLALGRLASPAAVAQLGRLKSRAKHISTRKQIARAFKKAAAIAGMTAADLVEIAVPTFGMTEVGQFSQQLGEFNAEVTLHSNKKPSLKWLKPDGKPQASVPAAVKSENAESLKSLKKSIKDIGSLMPSLRDRTEKLLQGNREWNLTEFRKRYLDHPLVGVVARRLIWNMKSAGKSCSAFWSLDRWVNSEGQSVDGFDNNATISIWHPLHSDPDEVHRWRNWLEANQVCQPFKQAHREVYVLTDAEKETGVYSNRFASHIIRQHQLAALCQQRGWRFGLQGDFDSWNAPCLDLPEHQLRVEFFVEPMEGISEITASFIYTHLATDQVRFSRLPKDRSSMMNPPLPLSEVPARVFSEVMRDVDLFVGVTSVGNDPTWHDHQIEGRYADYWETFSFGDLSQSAQTRRETLESVVPRLKIAKQCHFEDRFLVVEGKLRTYKIHLGSGNILMSPDDQYLCIVQKRGSGAKRTDNIFLPFEGDNTLSIVLSKAFLLAEDDKIKDTTIVNQIRLDR